MAATVVPAPGRLALALAFATVYVVWGSTYLAIALAVETMPPFLMASTRFLVAGALLVAWARARGAAWPTAPQWRTAVIVGCALLAVGNGSVSWAEQRVPSGIASLLIAAVPLWMVLFEMLDGVRPTAPRLAGVFVGLVGVAVLVLPAGGGAGVSVDPAGAAALVFGSLSWTAGSLHSRRADSAPSAPMASGAQMLAGGTALACMAAIAGEPSRLVLADVAPRSWAALAFLVVAGSLLAFSAYMWLLRHASPTAVGTYAYVNPVVAVLLGVAVLGEALTPRAVTAMAIILGGVVLVTLAPRLGARRLAAGATAPTAASRGTAGGEPGHGARPRGR